MILYVCAILLVGTIGHNCSEGETYEDFADCERMFGTIINAIFTLFQVITLESWAMAVVRPIFEVEPVFALFFVAYLFLTSFGLMNIVVGVIVDNTLETSKENDEKLAKIRERERARELEALKVLFEESDADGSGLMNKEEFIQACQSENAQKQFEALELPVDGAEELFEILDGAEE